MHAQYVLVCTGLYLSQIWFDQREQKYLLEWRNLIDALDSIFYPIQDKLSQTKINPIADTMVVANYWPLVT